MRSNQNLETPPSRGMTGKVGLPPMPVEWFDAGSWRLPSGKALAEFALQAGFLAPLLFQPERLTSTKAGVKSEGHVNCGGLRQPEKNFEKGSGR